MSDYGEPWAAEDCRIYDCDDSPVVFLMGGIIDPERLRRAVACVNALAGVPTEALEGGAVAKLVAAAQECAEWRRKGAVMPCRLSDGQVDLAVALEPFIPPGEARDAC